MLNLTKEFIERKGTRAVWSQTIGQVIVQGLTHTYAASGAKPTPLHIDVAQDIGNRLADLIMAGFEASPTVWDAVIHELQIGKTIFANVEKARKEAEEALKQYRESELQRELPLDGVEPTKSEEE